LSLMPMAAVDEKGKMIIKRKLQVAVDFACGRRCG